MHIINDLFILFFSSNSSMSSPTNITPGVAHACLICRPNSHPFNDRTLTLDQPVKVICLSNFFPNQLKLLLKYQYAFIFNQQLQMKQKCGPICTILLLNHLGKSICTSLLQQSRLRFLSFCLEDFFRHQVRWHMLCSHKTKKRLNIQQD